MFIGALEFVKVPPSVVYVPPLGFGVREVLCTTNEPSNITWVFSTGVKLDEMTYNITSTSDGQSTMYLSRQLVESLTNGINFITSKVRCHAGSEMSTEFKFALGGE